MWNAPTQAQLATLPKLYATEKIPWKKKIIHLHFFIFDCDWYIVEYDGKDTFFGFSLLNGDLENAQWDYISFCELKNVKIKGFEIDRDRYWQPKPAQTVEKVHAALVNRR